MLINKTITEFLEETASNKPVPGGGSIAAQSGATAAALVEMVANLTIGKKAYENVSDEMHQIIFQATALRSFFIQAIDEDSNAFDGVMAAYKLPKENEQEKGIRNAKIEESTKHATLVPLEVARKSLEVIKLSDKVVLKGNKNAITDGAVSAMMARTAALSAIYNVKINLGTIKDIDFVNETAREIKEIEMVIRNMENQILEKINL